MGSELEKLRADVARLTAERDVALLDAERYRVLRCYTINSASWGHRGAKAPGGLIAWSRHRDEPGMTATELDSMLDDMLGRVPRKDVRSDYQQWRAESTAESIRGAALTSIKQEASNA